MQTYLRLLNHSNLQRLLDAVSVLYEPVRPQRLPGHFAAIVRELIPGAFHGVSIVVRPKRARDRGRRDTVMSPVPANWENLAEIFASQYMKFPLRSIRESVNLHEPLALSHIASDHEFP